MGTFGTPSSYNNTGALGSATNPTTAQGLSRDRENQKAILELPGTQAWVEKTITDGVIIPTSAEIVVLPEGGASTDSLTTIALTSDGTTTLHEGMPIRLKAANSNTITVVHGAGTNNISTIDGNNVVLDTTWYLELKLINGLWVQQETSAYKIANEAKTTAEAASTPATTTSRGIARVATLDDMEPGAVVENGPAFPDVQGGAITPTPTAHAIPQAGGDGKLDGGWIPSDSAKLNVGMDNADLSQVNPVLSYNRYETNSAITISNAIALGTGTPNNTGGTQVMALTVVPKKVGSVLIIRAHVVLGSSANTTFGCAAIFKNNDTNAIAVSPMWIGSNGAVSVDVGTKIKTTSTDPISIKIRAGTNTTQAYLNGYSVYSPVYGVSTSYLEVTEYAA